MSIKLSLSESFFVQIPYKTIFKEKCVNEPSVVSTKLKKKSIKIYCLFTKKVTTFKVTSEVPISFNRDTHMFIFTHVERAHNRPYPTSLFPVNPTMGFHIVLRIKHS